MTTNDSSKFQIRSDPSRRILYVKLSGTWNEQDAKSYKEHLSAGMSLFRDGKPWYELTDISDFPIQDSHTQQVIKEVMALAISWGMQKAAKIATDPLGLLQNRRLSREAGIKSFEYFPNKEEAEAWLLKK